MLLDIITLIILLIGIYSGYQRGIIKTVFDTLSIMIAIIACLKLSPIVIKMIDQVLNFHPGIHFILGVVLSFFLVMLLVRFIGKNLEKLLKTIHLNFVNKIAGAVLMGIVFMVLFSYLIYLADELSVLSQTAREESVSYPILKQLPSQTAQVFESVKPLFEEFWNITKETIEQIKVKSDGVG